MWIFLPAELKLKLAPKTFWITTPVEAAAAPLKYKQAPKNILIHNFIIKTEIAQNINWIHNFTVRLEIAPKITWIHNCAVKNNLANLTLILSHIELTIATTKLESNPVLNNDSIKHKQAPKNFLIHNFTVKLEIAPNINWIHNYAVKNNTYLDLVIHRTFHS